MAAQFQILSKVVSSGDYSIISLNNLSEDYFYDYKAEFNFIKKHYELYNVVPDKLTFLEHFPDFVKDVSHWVEVREPDNYLVECIDKAYQKSKAALKINEAIELYNSNKDDEFLSLILHLADDIKTASTMKSVDLFSDTSRYDRYLEKAKSPNNFYLKTGFPELDAKITGIDLESENMVIVARTGIGKTWMLTILAAAAAAQGLNVGFYSGEMTVDKIGYRLDTLISNINNRNIMQGNLIINQSYKRYIDNIAAAANKFMVSRYPDFNIKYPDVKLGSFKVITPNDIPGEPTVDALSAFIEKESLDILFVDQYSLLVDTGRARAEHERIANISKAIKNLQVRKRIPIISVSQQNRMKNEDKNGKKQQDTTQIAGSDRIGQDATTIIMLDRSVDKDTGEEIFEINIQKARDGGDGTKLKYLADFNTGSFVYIPEGDSHMMSSCYDEDEDDDLETRYN